MLIKKKERNEKNLKFREAQKGNFFFFKLPLLEHKWGVVFYLMHIARKS